MINNLSPQTKLIMCWEDAVDRIITFDISSQHYTRHGKFWGSTNWLPPFFAPFFYIEFNKPMPRI